MQKQLFFVISCAAVCAGVYIAQEECPPNEEYLLCGSACPFNCTNPAGPVVCSEDCIEGCFCKAGYLRNETGDCVPVDQCVGNDTICGPNEEFLSCGSVCPRTCTTPDPEVCGLACSMGCFCKAGYVRDTVNNQCVTLEQCPVEVCLDKNEVYDICNASCEPTCADPGPICPKICTGGCMCKPGFYRSYQGDCVTVEKCANITSNSALDKYMDVINKFLFV